MTKIAWCTAVVLAAFSHGAASALGVVDDSNRAVRLAEPARRVVSLAPHLTELVADVGAVESLVAVSAYSDYPAQVRTLPQVGSSRALDLETIAALRPDLVLAWTSGASPTELEQIERLGIPVYRSEPKTLEDIATSLERIGRLTGHEATGREAARAFRDRAASLSKHYGGRTPVRVFYQVWDEPLMTIGGSHVISAVITACSGVNVFAALHPLSPTVDRESAILANPQVIIAASNEGGTPSAIAAWLRWPDVDAVKYNRFLILEPALITRQTPRILDGAQRICEALQNARAP